MRRRLLAASGTGTRSSMRSCGLTRSTATSSSTTRSTTRATPGLGQVELPLECASRGKELKLGDTPARVVAYAARRAAARRLQGQGFELCSARKGQPIRLSRRKRNLAEPLVDDKLSADVGAFAALSVQGFAVRGDDTLPGPVASSSANGLSTFSISSCRSWRPTASTSRTRAYAGVISGTAPATALPVLATLAVCKTATPAQT